jgi:ferritin
MSQLSQKMTDALNDQINVELASAYTYLSMSSYCQGANLMGAASWLRLQWEEELDHAMKIIDHVGERDGSVALKAIARPPKKFDSLLDVFEQVLEHEKKVTAAIHKLYNLAVAEKDYASQTFLQWYVNEQVEEENSASEIISMLRLAGDSGPGLFMVDRQLAERSPAPSA